MQVTRFGLQQNWRIHDIGELPSKVVILRPVPSLVVISLSPGICSEGATGTE